ncbi:MAG: amidohydrolase [Ruminococcus sp.]|nr:amidohydrolase [Ruminococcus sp.]MBQ8297666.1 amidohydrolase [Ruminococcus sp.]
MNIFDFHTHAFVDSLAERAVSALEKTSGIAPYTDGTVSGLREAMHKNGISGALLLPVATKPSQQNTINNWAAEIMGKGLYCCGTIHPDAEDAIEEIERIKSLGLCGVKFHSEYQNFHPDEDRMFPLYRKIAETGMFAVFHGGWDPLSKDYVRGTPERFAKAAEAVPELTSVIAHLGGMNLWDDVEKYLAGKFDNLYFDVSVIAGYIDPQQLLRIIRKHGAERILFGTDCPWSAPESEICMIEELPLTAGEKELIFAGNAERLLKLG